MYSNLIFILPDKYLQFIEMIILRNPSRNFPENHFRVSAEIRFGLLALIVEAKTFAFVGRRCGLEMFLVPAVVNFRILRTLSSIEVSLNPEQQVAFIIGFYQAKVCISSMRKP